MCTSITYIYTYICKYIRTGIHIYSNANHVHSYMHIRLYCNTQIQAKEMIYKQIYIFLQTCTERGCAAHSVHVRTWDAPLYMLCAHAHIYVTPSIHNYIYIYIRTHTHVQDEAIRRIPFGDTLARSYSYTHTQMYTCKRIYTTYTSIHTSITCKPMHVHIQTFTGRGNAAHSVSGRIGTRVCHWSP